MVPRSGSARRYVQNHVLPADLPGVPLAELDTVDELWFDTASDLAAALDGLPDGAVVGPGLERLVEREGAIAVAAEESVRFDRGFGAVKFIGLSRRHPGMTHEEWCRYWIDVHGPLAHGIPEFTRYYGRYVHNYVLPAEPGAPVVGVDRFDGIVEEWVRSVDDFARCLAEPKYLEIVRPDERKFVDFARSRLVLAEEHEVDVR